ncbi:PH1570 family protein [Thermococcus paralvinellae]|uniref:PH1570-like domain-containing protein n=1 Tax=Thermococcus paralvinellae TaxID=582419 RepID=W0I763_9EURY|nr:PH1570 family protein [Thermococcus paralvinellae]AHF80300.1 Hypothetical protein TES1_0914 [Thermococcus paralvinellae]
MQCEEKLEVFENGFEDGKFNLRIEFYGADARKVLLAILYELYLPDYGLEYVYPFECAKEFWDIYMDASEVQPEELKLGKPKFVSRAVIDKLEAILENIEAPREVKESIDLEKSEIYKLKDGLLALGKNFLLDGIKNRLFIFNKPSARELILKYIGRW